MKRKKRVSAAFLLCAGLCFSAGDASAQNYIVWSGGIGAEEREQAPTEGTKLAFFVKSGAFLSGVKVQIWNQQGAKVVETTTTGPWLILNLPPGRYTVQASLDSGEAQGAVINVDTENREFGFSFSG